MTNAAPDQRRSAGPAQRLQERVRFRPIDGWLQAIDPIAAVRGMSAGFSMLVVGSLLAPIVARLVPAVSGMLLTAVAVISFAVAASRQGTSQAPARQGATAAVGTYFLVLPLVYMAWHRWDAAEVGFTVLTAVVVGALVGHVASYVHRAKANA